MEVTSKLDSEEGVENQNGSAAQSLVNITVV